MAKSKITRKRDPGPQVALWSGLSAFFATLLAVGAINIANPSDQIRFLSSILVGGITGGAVYARERLHSMRNLELQGVSGNSGNMVVSQIGDKKIFSLELDEEPEVLEKMDTITFNVVKK